MNRTSHLLPEPKTAPPGDHLTGLFMGRVIAVDPTTYTAKVEVEDGSVTIQAAVMTLRAHDTRGWTWLPEEGELVVVAFLGGAKARPVILGSLFDSRDGIPNVEEGSVTLQHKSGTVLKIDQNGDAHLTHQAGADLTMDPNNVTLAQQGSGKLDLTHANGQKVTLTANKVEVDSANGLTKLTVDNALARLESNGSSVEVDNAGSINIFPAGGSIVSLGAGGTQFAVRDGDATGPPIGPLGSHTHQVIASGGKVIIGG